MNNAIAKHAQALVKQWCGEFVGVMQAMGDFSPAMEVHLAPPTRGRGILWWGQSLDMAPGAQLWIGAAEETWSVLAQRIQSAAGLDSSEPSELKDTYLEVLRQSLGALVTALGNRFGRAIVAAPGTGNEPPVDLAFGCQIAITDGVQELPRLEFYISQEMLDTLEQYTQQDAADSLQDSQPATEDIESGAEVSARACGTLDLLLDVEMPVSVSFGRTQVLVQDILKLITGSIIELDRSISEPVDVIVNNCIIARGEVVVVEGNYGVRINEVMSRRERLQESRKYLLPVAGNRR